MKSDELIRKITQLSFPPYELTDVMKIAIYDEIKKSIIEFAEAK